MNSAVLKKAIVNVIGIVGVAALSGSLQAASFDCARASAPIERLICSDSIISKQDEQLAQTYKAAMEKTANKGLLKKVQRAWLKEKRNICKDTGCLINAYQARIHELEANVTDSAVASTSTGQAATVKPRFELAKGKQFQLCKDFVELKNRVKENPPPNCGIDITFDDEAKIQGFKEIPWIELNVKDYKDFFKNHAVYNERKPSENKIKEVNEKFDEWFESTTARLWVASFDLNHDGKKDKVFKIQYRKCNSTSEIIIGRNDDALDELTYARNISGEPFFYQGLAYIRHGNGVQEGVGKEVYVFKNDICYANEIK